MPDQRLLFLARDARDRAEEILAKAENFKDADAKQKMHEIAEKYVKLAEQLEQAAADEP
jgi:hemerythrin-like domain-containing protein